MSGPVQPWLSMIGLHEDGLDGLGVTARRLVDGAETLIGDARMLALVADDGRERLMWPKPLTALFPEIERRRGRPVCVLASGDPLNYGIAALITAHFAPGYWVIMPAPSAFSLACARLGWPHSTVEILSLHNRPLAALAGFIRPNARLVVLTRDGSTPAAAASLLTELGYGASAITVFERMAGPHEARLEGRADAWSYDRLDDLNVMAIACAASGAALVLGCAPGLPDEAFFSDGMITKREARALTVSALMPQPAQILWDVGAGCGTVGIEWLRAAGQRSRVLAIESEPSRCAMIAANRARFGAVRLEIIAGSAPDALSGLVVPDAVFIGGGLTVPGVFDASLLALRPGGVMVVNTVTLEGERMLLEFHHRLGGELMRLAVARASALGRQATLRPQLPLTQWTFRKPIL
ncbi:MAG: precorrin-6y C5,15-methyltransferase (decarboxylating) subunit CbiE [Rhodospirillaceae bacterium]